MRTRFGDWVFCVMHKYQSNKSMQYDTGKKVNVNMLLWMLFCMYNYVSPL